MSRDPDIIQREIEQARDQLASTLDQLADRYSPKVVAERCRAAVVRKLTSPAGKAAVGVTAALVVVVVFRRFRRHR
ncbi:MAG TPA: DUF3618 domain-containing protein [Mycobacteriales bacterium]|nr:DUF3618 domain-containing protein [Mycobacteriales bacterium]